MTNRHPGLVTDYLQNIKINSFEDHEQFFQFLKLLAFIRSFHGPKQFIDDQVYYLIEFPAADYAKCMGINPKSTYQRRKILALLGKALLKDFLRRNIEVQ